MDDAPNLRLENQIWKVPLQFSFNVKERSLRLIETHENGRAKPCDLLAEFGTD
jgi:hypothetical protein